MQYWILQHNPATFSPPPKVASRNKDYWRIRRYVNRISIDDLAFIWHAGPSAKRGIYNVATIISVPKHGSGAENLINRMWKMDHSFYRGTEYTRLGRYEAILIKYQYQGHLNRPILVKELKRRRFANLPVIQMPQSGIYSLDQTTGKQLLKLIQQRWGMSKDCKDC